MNIHTDEGIDFIKSTLEIVRNVHPAFDNFLELGSPRSKAFKMWKNLAGKNIFHQETGSKIWLQELILFQCSF